VQEQEREPVQEQEQELVQEQERKQEQGTGLCDHLCPSSLILTVSASLAGVFSGPRLVAILRG
jgi:hypothetical protein